MTVWVSYLHFAFHDLSFRTSLTTCRHFSHFARQGPPLLILIMRSPQRSKAIHTTRQTWNLVGNPLSEYSPRPKLTATTNAPVESSDPSMAPRPASVRVACCWYGLPTVGRFQPRCILFFRFISLRSESSTAHLYSDRACQDTQPSDSFPFGRVSKATHKSMKPNAVLPPDRREILVSVFLIRRKDNPCERVTPPTPCCLGQDEYNLTQVPFNPNRMDSFPQ